MEKTVLHHAEPAHSRPGNRFPAHSGFQLVQLERIHTSSRFSNISSEKQLTSEDLEVVKNMEFLENMEELENLIKFLENPEYGKIPQRQKNKIQYG